jgi:uncharacterized protein
VPVDDPSLKLQRSIWLRIWQFPLVVMLVALALAIAAGIITSLVVEHVISPNVSDPLGEILGIVVLITLCFLVYKTIIRKLGRKKHDDLPLDAPAFRELALGLGAGALLISTCVALAAVFGVYRITGPDNFADWAEIIFLTGIYAGFFEELLIRGIVLRWLEELAGSWIALLLSSLLFGFLHGTNDNATFFSSLAIAIEAGVLLGAAYMLTRSLWLAIGLHAGWNVVQALWDVPVSGFETVGPIAATLEGHWLLAGGGFGLEATIFALIVATSAGIGLLVLASRKGRLVRPMWRRGQDAITAY